MIKRTLDTRGEYEAYILALEDFKKSFISKMDADINFYRDSMKFIDFDKRGRVIK